MFVHSGACSEAGPRPLQFKGIAGETNKSSGMTCATTNHGMSEASCKTSSRGRAAACHPGVDNHCDHERFVPVKADDPRLLGEGPCGSLHELKSEGPQEVPNVSIHGNQFARWVDCKVCALRLGYWPRVGARGRPAGGPPPDTVRAAFALLREAGRWECCTAMDMRAALQAVECQARVAGQSGDRRLPALPGKATPRPASCGPGAGATTQSPVQPRQRAASVAGDGRASRHITVQVVVNAV